MTPDDLCLIEEIKQLKYRYVRAIDTHDWPLMSSCFAADATFDPDSGGYQEQGREAIVSFFEQLIGPSFVSSHCVSHPEIELTSQTTARGRWRLEDVVHFTAPNSAVKSVNVSGGQELHGAAYYYDEYELGADGWRIKSLTYVRIFKSIERTTRDGFELTINPVFGVLPDLPSGTSTVVADSAAGGS